MKLITKILIGVGCTVAVAAAAFVGLKVTGVVGTLMPDYEKVIPADAEVVVSFNLNDFVNESGLLESKLLSIIPEGNELPASVKKILDDPKRSGLRLDKEAYGWVDYETKCGGLVIGMYKAKDFKNTVSEVYRELEGRKLIFKEEGGLTWITEDKSDYYDSDFWGDDDEDDYEIEEGYAIAYNDDYLVIAFGDHAEQHLKACANLSKKARYENTDRYSKLCDQRGELKVDIYLSPDLLREVYDMAFDVVYDEFDSDMAPLIRMLAGYVTAQNIDLGYQFGLDLKKGAIDFVAAVYSSNKAINSYYHDMPGAKNISSKLLGYVPSDYIFWFGANWDWNKYVAELCKVDMVKSYLPMVEGLIGVSLEDIANAISGDMSFCASNLDLEDVTNMNFTFRMPMNDKSVLARLYNTVVKYEPNFKKYCARKGDSYVIRMDKYDELLREFGYETVARADVNDGYLCVSNTFARGENAENGLASKKSQITSSVFYMSVNPAPFAELFGSIIENGHGSDDERIGYELFSRLGTLDMFVEKGGKMTLRLNYASPKATIADLAYNIYEAVEPYLNNYYDGDDWDDMGDFNSDWDYEDVYGSDYEDDADEGWDWED